MQFAGQRASEFVFRDADRLVHASQSVFGDDTVAVLTEDQADRGGVGFVAEFVIHDVQIEIHLAGVLGLKCSLFQVDGDEATQSQMIEKQINVEVFVPDGDGILPTDEGEPLAEFE